MDLDQLSRIFVHASRKDLEELGPPLLRTMEFYRITSALRRCHFLAQVGHESGELQYREELASGAAYEGRRDLGNTHRGDGRKFKGRGLIQLTGRANYQRYANDRDLGDLLMGEPWRVSTDLYLCCDVAGWYWHTKKLNALADQNDLRAITLRVNGGYNGLRDRKRLLTVAKTVLSGASLSSDRASRSVSSLQQALNRVMRAGLVIDGIEGAATRRAVRTFQTAQGLTVDGVAGPETWGALERALSVAVEDA